MACDLLRGGENRQRKHSRISWVKGNQEIVGTDFSGRWETFKLGG